MVEGNIILIIVLVILVLVIGKKGIKIVKQANVLIIERLGRFNRVAQSGINFIVPFLDRIRPMVSGGASSDFVDLRERVLDFEPQPVITKDNVTMSVDTVVYYQITDPRRAMYEIVDLGFAITQLTITTLRNVMGELALDETLVSRETVNNKLRSVLDEATDKWGVKVNRVELKNIEPPGEIQDAMAKQMKAERERRATVTEAEGTKAAAILKAEGERNAAIAEAEGRKKAAILAAEGEAEAILKVQRAEAEAIKLVYNAIHEGNPTNDLIAIKYMDALKEMARGDANKVFLPYEATGVLGSIAGIKEILTERRKSQSTEKKESESKKV
ncbi:MAG: SPFH/Band 7/PHB domain protein [Proteobacteria bacterium]|nr:SPFH/Band 7/PHB domain protein [Pseudomonadota bacterium]